MKNMISNISTYDKGLIERLGTWITVWYPSIPKTYGLYFMRTFLEEKHVWQKFLTYFHMIEKRKGFTQVFEYILRTKDVQNLFQWAFAWEKTEEGEKYWAGLNQELNKLFSEKKKEGYRLDAAYSKDFNTKNLFSSSIQDACNVLKMLGQSSRSSLFPSSNNIICIGSKKKEEKLPFSVPITSTTIVSIA